MTAASTAAPQMRASVWTGLAFAFVGVASFSLTLPMTSLAVRALDLTQVVVWRAIWAAVLAALFILWDRGAQGGALIRPRGRQWGVLCICALGLVFGFPCFTTLALSTVSASDGAVVVGLLPLVTAVIGVFVSDERPPLVFWIVALVGTALTVGFVLRQSGGLGGRIGIGHLYFFAAVLSAGVGYAFGGQLSKSLSGWRVACWSLIVASPVLLLLGALYRPVSLATPVPSLMAFVYLAVVSQLLGFFAWYRGMAMAGIARASQVQLLQLFLTVAAAVLILGEPFDPEVILFGGAVALCVAIGTRVRILQR